MTVPQNTRDSWRRAPLLSHGIRPFFLGAALWAMAGMALWIAALTGHARPVWDGGPVVTALHVTSLTLAAPKICFNTNTGDCGDIEQAGRCRSASPVSVVPCRCGPLRRLQKCRRG